jgi:hypothetical protein
MTALTPDTAVRLDLADGSSMTMTVGGIDRLLRDILATDLDDVTPGCTDCGFTPAQTEAAGPLLEAAWGDIYRTLVDEAFDWTRSCIVCGDTLWYPKG